MKALLVMNDLEIGGAADVIGDESAVGDDGHTAPHLRQRCGQQRAAAPALDHDGVAVLYKFCGAKRDLPFLFVVVGEAPLDIIRAGQNGEAVLPGDQPLRLHGIQVLADGDLGDAQARREFGDFQFLFPHQKLQDLTGAVFFSSHIANLPDELYL